MANKTLIVIIILMIWMYLTITVIHNFLLLSDQTKEQSKLCCNKNNGKQDAGPNNYHFWHQSIPRILHQTWKSREIPGVTASWVASWMNVHSRWEYWFWTDDDTKELFARYFYFYYSLYVHYPWSIQRADIMRYFILWLYGGIYADLDMECLRPLDNLLSAYSCIMAREPEEIAYVQHMRNMSIASNAFMACRPRHPFIKFIVNNLYSRITMNGLLETTGPFMLTEMLIKYKEGMGSPPRWEDDVYLAPAHYFMPYYGVETLEGMRRKCKVIIGMPFNANPNRTLSTDLKRESICFRILAKGIKATATSVSPFTNHHWLHTYINPPDEHRAINIKQVIPSVKNVSLLFLDVPPYVEKVRRNKVNLIR